MCFDKTGYVDQGMDFYEQTCRHQQIQLPQKKAASMGFQLTGLPASV
jgi:hypothetical protein